VITTVSGAALGPSGHPFDSWETTALSGTGPALELANTGRTELLMVFAFAKALDSNTASVTSWTSPTFPVITERYDGGTDDGNGGGVAVATAPLAPALALGDAGVTITVSQTSTTIAAACYAIIGADSVLCHPVPRFRAAGSLTASASANITPNWPSPLSVDDIGILAIETPNGVAAPLTTANGFAEVPFGDGGVNYRDSAAATGTRLTLYWCRATSTTPSNPVVTFVSDHVAATIRTYAGCITAGDPWSVLGGDEIAANSTAVAVPSITTTINGSLIAGFVAHGADTASNLFGTWVNAGLEYVNDRTSASSSQGNGGGLGIFTAVQALAGATGDTTNTLSTTSGQARGVLALRPPRDLRVTVDPVTVTLAPQDVIALIDRALIADHAAVAVALNDAEVQTSLSITIDSAAVVLSGLVDFALVRILPTHPIEGAEDHVTIALRRLVLQLW
jgi:hypothetical protein